MYLALYRKYRPSGFRDVVGQQPIVSALKNQIKGEKVGHAYLFCGTRGTGKTSCAKIFAKAISCLNPQDGDACLECAVCKAEQNGTNLDTQEIDAASNNGVDFIRELREETVFAPTTSRYKVYIIDEVHMLSGAAFNALLKIMEEPPEYVVFMLATTEIHKVPATILSRCQRFDFRRIEPDVIKKRLLDIADTEGIDLPDDAASLIASLADGGMRDALSLLDTVSSASGEITTDNISMLAGIANRDYLFELSDMVESGDINGVAKRIADLHSGYIDEKQLIRELMNHYKNLMLASMSTGLLERLPDNEREQYRKRASQDISLLLYYSDLLAAALDRIASSGSAEAELSLALFKMANSTTVPSRPVEQTSAPNRPTANIQPTAPSPPSVPSTSITPPSVPSAPLTTSGATSPPEPVSSIQPPPLESPKPQKITPPPKPLAEITDEQGELTCWSEVIESLKDKNPLAYASLINTKAYVDSESNRVLIDGNEMFLNFMRKDKENNAIVRDAINEISGHHYSIGPYKKPTTQTGAQDTLRMLEEQGVKVEYSE